MRQLGPLLALAALTGASCSSPQEQPETPPPAERPVEEPAQAEGPAGEPGAQEDRLGQAAGEIELREQKDALLVETHLRNARSFLENVRFEDAERELLMALRIDPDNEEAIRLLNEVNALLGKPGIEQSVSDYLAEYEELRAQQLRLRAEESERRAERLLARGEYDAAINELTLALTNVEWGGPAGAAVELQERLRAKLEAAKADRAAAFERERAERNQQALEDLREREAAARRAENQRVARYVSNAIEAFEKGDYDAAEEWAEQALRRDPRNMQALDIRDASFRAGLEQTRSEFTARKLEQYARWEESMEELRVPYTPIVTLPDEDFWQQITDVRRRRTRLDRAAVVSQEDESLRTLLENTQVPGLIIEENDSLNDVIGILRTTTGLPLVVDQVAEEAAIDEGALFDFNLTHPLSAVDALNLITDTAGEQVTWTIRHNAVLVTTVEKARGELMIYNHDVQDLIFGLTDFLAPRISKIRLLEDLEDDDGGGPFGSVGDRPTIIEPDDLATLVQENVAVQTWDGEGVSINVELGNMIVVNTPEVQLEIKRFLDDLRRFSSSLVTIESKFMTIEDNWLQEIGVDFRGLDNPGDPFTDLDDVTNGLEDDASAGLDNGGTGTGGSNAAGPPSAGFFFDDGEDGDAKGHLENLFENPLGNVLSNIGGFTAQYTFLNDLQVSMIVRMIEKSTQAELINDQVVSVHNTQRAYVTVINQRAYIQDFDVEVATAEVIADPQINVLTEGIVLDVRPTIHHDRKYLTLEIQPTVAEIVALADFSTTLGAQTSPVEFQLPELEVKSVFTTAVIPDGGSILVGGLSRLRNVERRAETPWLANIPLLGFFFKEEGYSDEKSSLMILLRAWITDVKDELRRFDARQ